LTCSELQIVRFSELHGGTTEPVAGV